MKDIMKCNKYIEYVKKAKICNFEHNFQNFISMNINKRY